jgi:DNA-directed RNA polymerase subunit RPC12/RpoP
MSDGCRLCLFGIFPKGVILLPALQQYKCPCCDGAIEFHTGAQKMKCPYCDSEFDMADFLPADEVLNQPADTEDDVPASEAHAEAAAAEDDGWQEGEADGLRVYACKTCGGEIVCDETTAATSCPFCGNPVVMMGQLSGVLRPDYVIPFRFDKKAAVQALKKHYGGKPLLPKVFMQENHIDEIKGVYVPVWLFDGDADANIHYKGTRIRTWSDSRYDYTETSYYSIVRGGTMGFERVPVDGSTKMDDALMESIEPFDFSGAVDFQTAYLSGYFADKYDVDADQSIQRANERIQKSTEEAFAATVQDFVTVTPESSSIRLEKGTVKYALLPVWLLNTTWNGQNYTFAMNGQTGKLVGDLPVDKAAYRKWLLGLTAVFAAVIYGLSYLLWLL